MYKTIWMIMQDDGTKLQLIFYHFGEQPKFPSWYLQQDSLYTIEMLWNIKLINSIHLFFKCLFHDYVIKKGD